MTICALSLILADASHAQGGPLRNRLQDKVQRQVEQQAAQSRAQIEQQVEQKIASMPSPAEIVQVRQVQTALNFFEFDAGSVDGIMGQRTRDAIERYQAYLDYPVTGELAEAEAQFLFGAYQKAQANAAEVAQVAQSHPDGIKGLLLIFRDGPPTQNVAVMPSFEVQADALSQFCSEPETSAPIGPVFCDAREAAMAQSDSLVQNVATFSVAQIEEQCLGFEPALVALVASLAEDPAEIALQKAAEFVERSGQDADNLRGISEVCLGIGYRRERLDLAIGTSVLLVALDRPAYAEFPGYHLALGLGVSRDPERARAWFQRALQSEGEAASDFERQAAGRLETLQSALATGNTVGGAVPAFSVTP